MISILVMLFFVAVLCLAVWFGSRNYASVREMFFYVLVAMLGGAFGAYLYVENATRILA